MSLAYSTRAPAKAIALVVVGDSATEIALVGMYASDERRRWWATIAKELALYDGLTLADPLGAVDHGVAEPNGYSVDEGVERVARALSRLPGVTWSGHVGAVRP